MTSTTTAAASASGAGDVSSHATQPRRAGLQSGLEPRPHRALE